jgi:hypothetical protein
MKPKKTSKKLVLKKVTISTLNPDQLDRVKGGVSRTCGTHFCCTVEGTCDTCINSECACSNPCDIPLGTAESCVTHNKRCA